MNQLVAQKATVLSLDSLLRTLSRGQSFDVLSSQANVAGYRAVIEAAHQLQRPFAGACCCFSVLGYFGLGKRVESYSL